MKKLVGFIGAAVLVLACHAPARALDLRVGANANYGTSDKFGLGPRAELDLGEYVPGLRLVGDYHKFFESGVYDSRVSDDLDGITVKSSSWDAGFHVTYDFSKVGIGEGASLYAGAGILYVRRQYDHWLQLPAGGGPVDEQTAAKYAELQNKYSDDKGIGWALTVGSTFSTGWTVLPFVEARYTNGVVDEIMLALGLLFTTGPSSK